MVSTERSAAPPVESEGASRRALFLNLAVILLLLVGLPLALWLDLRAISARSLRAEADELAAAINAIRDYYANNVVGRILDTPNGTQVIHNYQDIPGAIPIPATLSLELGRVIRAQDGSVKYRFFSDYPFANRAPHDFDEFEEAALAELRRNPEGRINAISGNLFDRKVRLVTPILMGTQCVSCHNSHPLSPKRDWKVGDVRGIQEIAIRRPIADNILAFDHLLLYFAAATAAGLYFIRQRSRQAAMMRAVNRKLAEVNRVLEAASAKLGKFLPPQLFRSIFTGEKDVRVATERKKLTIFFSDIVDFTATTERLQPEELAALLNEYLTEMSRIAAEHGGTVDKFIGDAILIFFGDPETKGAAGDAAACLAMALAMQRRLAHLNAAWRQRGIERPFRARMGINTGFCNVGNFGSDDRLAYTIIGAEANLAARLQAIAEPGGIVLSYETYALVRERTRARALAPIQVKGIGRTIVPYAVEGLAADSDGDIIAEHRAGLDLFLDVAALAGGRNAALAALRRAVAALEAPEPSETAPPA